MMIVKGLDCPYTFSMNHAYETGMMAEVTPLCHLTDAEAIVFLAAGIMGNIFIVIFLSILNLYARRKKHMIWGNMLTFAMIGFASDPLFYFFATEGDIITILKIVGKQENIYIFNYLGYLFGAAVMMYLWSHLSFTIEHKTELEKEWERLCSLKRRAGNRFRRA
ncbi:MAG: hypothetical protein GXO64_04310 [Candidatus Micrarchaeota archaeon]|nr:hypothetical protein [Candidatus Micrarchaeota archaeon]